MTVNIETPALLFSATSLILLAYTNRFLTIAQIIRGLKQHFEQQKTNNVLEQINNLKLRINLIRYMQMFGVISLFLSVFSMMLLYFDFLKYGAIFFALSLLTLLVSLAISFWEISISVRALHISLSDLEQKQQS